jgi:hypothetical protein
MFESRIDVSWRVRPSRGFLAVLALSLVSTQALADAGGLPPLDCAAGEEMVCHAGSICALVPCETDADCKGTDTCRPVDVCVGITNCVEFPRRVWTSRRMTSVECSGRAQMARPVRGTPPASNRRRACRPKRARIPTAASHRRRTTRTMTADAVWRAPPARTQARPWCSPASRRWRCARGRAAAVRSSITVGNLGSVGSRSEAQPPST